MLEQILTDRLAANDDDDPVLTLREGLAMAGVIALMIVLGLSLHFAMLERVA